MSAEKIMIVTGANQGLGLALVRQLCQQPAIVYLTARDAARGQAATEQLQQEGLQPAFHLLDVTDDQSVQDFATHIHQQHGGADVVISNAAARISRDVAPAEQVANFINTNNHGTYRMVRAFAPLLKDGGRFLVVASSFGRLRHLDTRLHPKFEVSRLSLEDIEHNMDEYVAAVQSGTAVEQGWPEWINIPSKIGQVASMKILAREMTDEARQRDILINAVCPGLVDTEASRPWFADMSAAKSPDEAAQDVVWLATLPPQTTAPYGELVQYRRVLRWE
ncbi:MAG: SDR family NAD(P)-dependent oxidoreductase [Anaerolineae bacterium]|nr:SDR family NAD(P)-dependent oxidoreductase [Anaerolineae bacterium]